jgi:serine protease
LIALGLLLLLGGGGEAPAAAALANDPARSAFLSNDPAHSAFLPNDPALSTLETAPGTPVGTPLEWWAIRENLPQAWSITHGDGALVAVIDSGVDATHPDLAGKIAYLKDIDGEPGEGAASVDRSGHGTSVAGLACAAADNGIGLAGAGYNCRLLIEKSDLTDASEARAILDATNHGAQAINMSFGTDGAARAPARLRAAIRYAYRHKVILVAAAADEAVSEQGYPADILQPPGTGPKLGAGLGLTVTSADFAGRRSLFSGHGSEISMAAYGSFGGPGVEGGPPGIFSTFPANLTSIESGISSSLPACAFCRVSLGNDDRYSYLTGTSMAAPQVAAVAAMIRQLAPSLSAAQIIQLLKSTARRPPRSGWSPELGWGILDAGAAVSAAQALSLHAPATPARPARRRSSRRGARCRASHRSRRAGRSSSGRCRT